MLDRLRAGAFRRVSDKALKILVHDVVPIDHGPGVVHLLQDVGGAQWECGDAMMIGAERWKRS